MDEYSPRWVFLNAEEAYLKAIYELHEELGDETSRSDLRLRLGITRASVDQFVHRLHRGGLVDFGARQVFLTDAGARRAIRIIRKHRLTERLLVDLVGLEWELAHNEASRWQHVLGERVERRLLKLLDRPWLSPYGNPIPGLDELAPDEFGAGYFAHRGGIVCEELAQAGGGPAVVQQIREGLQSDVGWLRTLHSRGIVPGARVTVFGMTSRADSLRVRVRQREITLDRYAARSLVLAARYPSRRSALSA